MTFPNLSRLEVQLGIFPSLRMRPKGISHTSLVLLERNMQIKVANAFSYVNINGTFHLILFFNDGYGFRSMPQIVRV
jgi:hypothetical protein